MARLMKQSLRQMTICGCSGRVREESGRLKQQPQAAIVPLIALLTPKFPRRSRPPSKLSWLAMITNECVEGAISLRVLLLYDVLML